MYNNRKTYRIKAIIITLLIVINSSDIYAQGDGARFYWKGMAGTSFMPVIGSSMGGNSNPMDPSHLVVAESNFESTMAMPGFGKIIPLFDRSATISVIVPMGRISSDMSLGIAGSTYTTRGFGDPMVQAGINLIGPKAIKNIPEMIRYKPGFSLDLIGSLALPLGEYDSETPLNIGQNRWYGRLGVPVVWQIGAWVPGRRTTLEVLPALWFFGDNNDYVGKKMETKPMVQMEGHLTHDFMEHLWGSLDGVWYTGGQATIDGVQGTELNNMGLGGTIGYQINSNLQLNVSYSSTINDSEATDLKMDSFRLTLLFGWHDLVESMNRMKE
jgi:hypothetical protein